MDLMPNRNNIEQSVARYYEGRLQEHGTSHAGVDWNSQHSQEVRFDQLMNVVGSSTCYSLVDYGCGYGALNDWLRTRGHEVTYQGFDVSPAMVAAASEINGESGVFSSNLESLTPADYCVASGIFNIRLDYTDDDWINYVNGCLADLNRLSTRGFSFNMLTSWSDAELMQSHLYYADPAEIFNYCKKNFSRHVALLHDYELWEFTIIVRKDVA